MEEPKAATGRDDKIRESRRCRSSDEEEDPDEAQRRSKRSKFDTRHPSSSHRRIRDYRREEEKEMDRERGYRDYRREEEKEMHRERGYRREEEMHRERGDHGKSPYHHAYDGRSSRRYDDRRSQLYDDRSSRRRHDDSPQEDRPGDRSLRRLDLDEGQHGEDDPQTGQDVSEEPPATEEEKPTECLMLDNLFDKFVIKPFDDSFKIDESVILADAKAYAHEVCATKGGTVVKIHVDPYAGSVYVRFRDKCFAAAAKKAMDDGIYYNETRLIKATYIGSDDHRIKFVLGSDQGPNVRITKLVM